MFPKELKKIDQWSVHENKEPLRYNGKRPNLSFKNAKSLLKDKKYSGLSFNFKGTPYSYCDLDTYKEDADKVLHKRLEELACSDTYVEKSINGGTHIVYEGPRFKSAKAIDNRSNNLLYMTGNSIGKKKIGKLSKKFLKESKFVLANKPTLVKAFRSVNEVKIPFPVKEAFDEWLKKHGNKTIDDFPSRSELVFHLLNGARTVTEGDLDLMVALVDEMQISTNEKGVYEYKRLIGDAIRILEKKIPNLLVLKIIATNHLINVFKL